MADDAETVTFVPPPPSSSPVEIELKLTTDPDGLAVLAGMPELNGRLMIRRLQTTYYDTPDRRLAGRGVTLRVRRVGRRHTQTIKTAGKGSAAGLSRRGEWEWPVKGSVPDLKVIDDHAVQSLIGLIRPGELVPVFTTNVRRAIRLLRFPDAVVEVALDDGEVVAGERREQLHEVELELRNGEPERLYSLALSLHGRCKLGLDPRSKAARGESLATGTPPAPRFQSPADLPRDISVDGALTAIVEQCLTQWTENLPAALDGTDPEGIHQARVALRRLRSAFQLFRPVIGAAGNGPPTDLIRPLAAAMGPARDADVFIDEMLAPVVAAMPEDDALGRLDAAAKELRRQGYRQAHAALTDPAATEMALRVGHWLAVRGWREQPYSPVVEWLDGPMVGLADRLLQKRLNAVLKRGRRFASLTLVERHDVRIATKKLRYAVDFCAPLYERHSTKMFFKRLKRLQSLLGHLQDNAMATSMLGQLIADDADAGLMRASGLVAGWHAHAMAAMSGETEAAWRAFAKTKPFWHV